MNKRTGIAIVSIGIAAALSASVVADDDTDRALLERAQQLFKPLPHDAGTAEYPVTPEREAAGYGPLGRRDSNLAPGGLSGVMGIQRLGNAPCPPMTRCEAEIRQWRA